MSQPIPTDAARDLAELLGTRLSNHSIGRIMRSFMETEQWSPSDPVDEHGNCMLVVWMDHLLRGSSTPRPPDPETIELLLDGRSMREVLDRRLHRHSRTLRDVILERLGRDTTGSTAMDFFWSKEVFGAIEARHLEDIQWSSGSEGSPANRRLNVLRMALDANKIEVARDLIGNGWAWKAPDDGISPGVHIRTPEAWDLFLETGGDPFVEVESERGVNNPTIRPLWRHLLETSCYPDTETGKVIQEWAKTHAGDDLEQKAVQDYWRKLHSAYSINDIMKAIRSRKDWSEMKNKDGENVLFVGLRKHLSVVTQLAKVGKAKHLFSEVDHRGAGFWHHLMAREGVGSEEWGLAKEHANPRPNPEKGILVTLLDIPEGFGQKSLPSKESMQRLLAPGKKKAPTLEDWWTGSPEDLTRLGLYLQGHAKDDMKRFYWGSMSQQNQWFSTSDVAQRLSAILHAFPVPMDAPPELLGALAVNELLTSRAMGSGDNLDMFDNLMKAGATFSPPQKVAENLEKIVSEGFGGEVQTRYRQILMETEVGSAPEKGPKPSMRF